MSADHLTPAEKAQVTDSLIGRLVLILADHDGTTTASSSALASAMSINDGPSHPVIRAAIGEALRRGLAPICATSTGYFTARTERDVLDYVVELRNRAEAITSRAANVQRAWSVRQGLPASASLVERPHWVPDPEEIP